MAWQINNLQLKKWYLVDKLTPKEIGAKFKGNPVPEELVIGLLKKQGIYETPRH